MKQPFQLRGSLFRTIALPHGANALLDLILEKLAPDSPQSGLNGVELVEDLFAISVCLQYVENGV
jgi:hypothetical protein